ncbi:MAG: hypothetical protein WDN04_04430 [Rhodospirillales bacterium]
MQVDFGQHGGTPECRAGGAAGNGNDHRAGVRSAGGLPGLPVRGQGRPDGQGARHGAHGVQVDEARDEQADDQQRGNDRRAAHADWGAADPDGHVQAVEHERGRG